MHYYYKIEILFLCFLIYKSSYFLFINPEDINKTFKSSLEI